MAVVFAMLKTFSNIKRYFDSVEQNVIKHSKENAIQEKFDGPKLSERLLAKN